jgi:membrane associated rhomboid family serine protease
LKEEKEKIFRSFIYPVLFVSLLWLIRVADVTFHLNLNNHGLYPLEIKGLPGILTAPFLHADFSHLFANSIPAIILGALLFYFYREIAWLILGLLLVTTGSWVWVFARSGAAHIGASGIIYGLASFLFFSGIIRREKGLMVITLLVGFLYGGLIWGLFPELFPKEHISWESHLMGLLAGLILAVYYRKSGPQRQPYEWEDEDDNPDDPPDLPEEQADPEIHYEYTEKQTTRELP